MPEPRQTYKGSQVLEISPGVEEEEDDEEEDDADYRHLYTYGPRPAEDLADGMQQTAAPAPGTASSSAKNLPPKAPASSSSLSSIEDPLDPSDPAYAWRATVEKSLIDLSATSEAALAVVSSPSPSLLHNPKGQQAMSNLLKDVSVLGAHVEYMRKQPGSSRWLTAPCISFREASGGTLTIREAVADHVFRLMDLQHPELLLKACGVILRVVKSRQPLLQTSKVLYRLSKDTTNDSAFKKERLFEPILKTVSPSIPPGLAMPPLSLCSSLRSRS